MSISRRLPPLEPGVRDFFADHFNYEPIQLEVAHLQPYDYDHDLTMEEKRSTSRPVSRWTTATLIERDKEASEEQDWQPTKGQKLIMITMAISSLMVALDATILVTVLPTLAVDLHGSATDAFWTGTSYLLVHAVLQPFIASLSDVFGRRELLVPCISCFAIGSIVCGVAHNFTTMLVGRVIQGIGGAGIITLSQIIFADMIPLRFRPKYFTFILGAWALGSVIGPLVGGAFTQRASWRWCFYINLPICGIALPMAILFVKLRLTKPYDSFADKVRSVDWIGNILFVVGLTLFLIAISWAGVQFSWSAWQTLLPLVLGIVVIIVTIIYEVYFAGVPFLTRSLFSGRSTIASYLAAALQGMSLYMSLYYFPFYVSSELGFSPIHAGVSILPSTCFLLPGSAVVSALITRLGRFRWAVWTGWVFSTIASGVFLLFDDTTRTVVWAAPQCVFGLGMGMVLSSVNFSIQAAVEPEDAGQAAAMYAFMRSVGMTVGVAVGGTVFQNLMKKKLVNLAVPHAAAIAKDAEAYIRQLRALSTTGAEGTLRQNILAGYTHGFRGVWAVMLALSIFGLLVSLLIKRGNLNRALASKFAMDS